MKRINGIGIYAIVLAVTLALTLNFSAQVASTKPSKTEISKSQNDMIGLIKDVSPAIVSLTGKVPCTVTLPPGAPNVATGVVISTDGYILTSTGAVLKSKDEEKLKMEVRFSDGKKLEGDVIASDPANHISLIKVDTKGRKLPFVALGDSAQINAGDTVLTFGNSFGITNRVYEIAVSRGIITDISELDNEKSPYKGEVLMTDAAVNPGNQGGAMVNLEGQMVGLVIWLQNPVQDLGTSIPSNVVRQSLEKMFEKIKVKPPKSIYAKRSKGNDPGFAIVARRAAEQLAPAIVQLVVIRNKSEPEKKDVKEAPKPDKSDKKSSYLGGTVIEVQDNKGDDKKEKSSPPKKLPSIPNPGGPGPGPQRPMQPRRAPAPQVQNLPKRPENSHTSGIIVSEDGFIITSYNNVMQRPGENMEVFAYLYNGEKYTAKIVSRDQIRGFALLKIEAENLSFIDVTLPAPKTRIGKTVIAIGRSGNPKKLTITWGIVSALEQGKDGTHIQTDARVNYGNLGGALIDSEGNFIGLVSSYAAWINTGIGFAIYAEKIAPQLADMKTGKDFTLPPSPFIGVILNTTNETGGAVLDKVYPDQPAAKAGLKEGDRIVEADGKPINNSGELIQAITSRKIGDKIKLKVFRGETEMSIELVIGARPVGL